MQETLEELPKEGKVLTKYTREEVLEATLDYFNGDTLAAEVWINKYCLKDSDGNLYEKTPDDMHWRLAKELGRIEKNYPNPISVDEIYNKIKNFKKIIPQGSPMSGIGNDFQTISIGNCFVIGNDADSYGGIFKLDQEQAQLMKRRGGVGHDLSGIRPSNSKVNNSALTSTGVVPFMERYSNTTREVAQCLLYNTLILTKNGLKEIKNVQINDKVWTRIGWVSVNNVLNNGKREVYKLRTKKGFEIVSTKEHIYLNKNNQETKLKDFEIGDEIVLLEGTSVYHKELELKTTNYISKQPKSIDNLNLIKLPKTLNNDLGYFLGYAYGDGHFTYNKFNEKDGICLSVSKSDIDTVIKLQNIVKELFNYDIKISNGSGEVYVLKIHSIKLCNWLLENHIAKEKTDLIKLPNLIKKSNSEVQLSFFSGYFDADGTAHQTGKNVRVTSISKTFIYDLQNMLLSNGIICNVQTYSPRRKNRKKEYRLNIQGSYSQKQLKEKSTSIKLGLMERVVMQDNILTPYNSKDLNEKNIRNNYSYIPTSDRNISVSSLKRFYDEKGIENNLSFVDEIVSIEYYGQEDTYDLSLEKEHLFWANGFYVHNSGRRGALMQSISIKHPDSEAFIDAKMEEGKVTGANISVKITDEFMNAVKNGTSFTQQYPIDAKQPTVTKEINASKLWKKIIHNSWKSAEPGVLFFDNILKESIPSCYGKKWVETSTNPCGELPLPPYDSCRLLVVNLYGYVVNPFEDNVYFDWDEFKKDVIIAERLMDDIVDIELEKIDKIIEKIDNDPEVDNIKDVEKNLWLKIKNMAYNGRRTGLGITGEGDMLAALGLKYGTDEANRFSIEVHKELKLEAYRSSVIMSKERGAFPMYDDVKEENNPFIQRIRKEDPDLYKEMVKYGRRNIALLTIAPAGTTSIMSQTTSGIEPAFLISYMRRRKINPNDKDVRVDFTDEVGDTWMEYPVFHHNFKTWLSVNNYDIDDIKNNYTKDQIDELIKESPYYGATSNDVDWVKKVEMQGGIQQNIDHSISVTVNLPNDISEEMVGSVFEMGYNSGCKGITVYRDGSRSGVLISDTEKKKKKKDKLFQDNHAPKRPKRLKGEIVRFQNNHEKWIGVVGMLDGRPYEVFTGLLENGLSDLPSNLTECEIVKNKDDDGRKRYDIEYVDSNGEKQTHTGLNHTFNPEYWNYAKTISAVLRHGMPIPYVLDLIQSLNLNDEHLNTWKNGVARVMKKFIKDGEKGNGTCPSCGSENLEYKEGCLTCMSCGNSKCQ